MKKKGFGIFFGLMAIGRPDGRPRKHLLFFSQMVFLRCNFGTADLWGKVLQFLSEPIP